MPRILLADDSPHAQRMGEYILREEGYEVVSVTDGETAMVRLVDVDPDLVLADTVMPFRSGYQVCEQVKSHPALRHTRVVLTAGAHEAIDPAEALRVGADGTLKKPFEASILLATVRPLVEAAMLDRIGPPPSEIEMPAETPREAAAEADVDPEAEMAPEVDPAPEPEPVAEPEHSVASVEPPPDPERVRAAVAIALDDAMGSLIDAITERVLIALRRS